MIEWITANWAIALGAVYVSLSAVGQWISMFDGPDPEDKASKALGIIDMIKGFMRSIGIGARYKNEGPASILPGSKDTKVRIATTK